MAEPKICPASENLTRKSGDSSCQSRVIQGFQQFDRTLDLWLTIEGLDIRRARRAVHVQVSSVLELNVQTVLEHHRREVGRGGRAEDWTAIACSKEARKIAAMIDVRVRQDHAVERFRLAAEMRILGV